MIEVISIHIPKTAGTSFYNILRQVYGDGLSPSFKRRDLNPHAGGACILDKSPDPAWRAVHGHFTWQEVRGLMVPGVTKVITWLRDPVDRVISNYQFFIDRLQHPEMNPEVAAINLHRNQETLLEYARLDENRNRMSRFLDGLAPEDFFFIGFTENFEEDVARLGLRLGWPALTVRRLNTRAYPYPVSEDERQEIEALNQEDRSLYKQAKTLFSSSTRSVSGDE